jgi:hypothetical protein
LISNYSRSFDRGDIVLYNNPIDMIAAFKDYDRGMYRFNEFMELSMNELSASSDDVNQIRKRYLATRGDEIRTVQAYKQKGS